MNKHGRHAIFDQSNRCELLWASNWFCTFLNSFRRAKIFKKIYSKYKLFLQVRRAFDCTRFCLFDCRDQIELLKPYSLGDHLVVAFENILRNVHRALEFCWRNHVNTHWCTTWGSEGECGAPVHTYLFYYLFIIIFICLIIYSNNTPVEIFSALPSIAPLINHFQNICPNRRNILKWFQLLIDRKFTKTLFETYYMTNLSISVVTSVSEC